MDDGSATPGVIVVKRNSCGKTLDIRQTPATCSVATAFRMKFRVIRHSQSDGEYEGAHDVHALIAVRAMTSADAAFAHFGRPPARRDRP